MALSKSERLEIQAAAATNVKLRMEEALLKERQKEEKELFIQEENDRLLKEAQKREAEREAAEAKKAQKAAPKPVAPKAEPTVSTSPAKKGK